MNIRRHIAILALSAAGLWGQAMTQMTGTVMGVDGKPVQGAEVQINRTDIKAQYKIKTDKNGKFNYATLPKGTFDVTVTVNGQKVFDAKGMQTDYAKPTTVEVDIAKLAAAQQGGQQPQQQQQQAAPQPRQMASAAPASLPVAQGQLPPGGVSLNGGQESAPPQQAAATQAPEAAPAKMTPEELAAYEKQKKEFEDAQAKDKGLQDSFNQGMEAMKAQPPNYPVAIEAFKKAAQFDPKQHAVWGQMGDAYSKVADSQKTAAQRAERADNYNKAAEAYLKAVEIAPEDATYRYNASLVLARANKMDDAQAQLTKAVQLDPTQGARGYRNLGAVYFDTSRSEPAQAAYKKAIELDPKDANSHYQLGILLMQQATESNGKLNVPPGTEDELQAYMELAPTGPYAEEVKAMLQALGATVTNRVTRPGATPTKPAPAKAKGKQ